MNSYPAPAKINLHLRVSAVLSNGFHELDTSFAFVDVCDRLTIAPSGELSVTCSSAELNGEANLVFKVLHALREKYGLQQGLHVHVDKTLPDRAGLGGGSSDAATALLVANRLWNLNLSTDELISFAAPFGADIPCFLFGKASLASGIGEKLETYPFALPDGYLLLAYPGIGLSTTAVFSHFDASPAGARALTPQSSADTIRARSEPAVGSNDLEASACALSSEVEKLLAHLRSVSDRAWMSGSGSTCVALFGNREHAEAESRTLLEQQLASWTHVGRLLREHPLREQL